MGDAFDMLERPCWPQKTAARQHGGFAGRGIGRISGGRGNLAGRDRAASGGDNIRPGREAVRIGVFIGAPSKPIAATKNWANLTWTSDISSAAGDFGYGIAGGSPDGIIYEIQLGRGSPQ